MKKFPTKKIEWAIYTADPANDGKDYGFIAKSDSFPSNDYFHGYLGFRSSLSSVPVIQPSYLYFPFYENEHFAGGFFGYFKSILPPRSGRSRILIALFSFPHHILINQLQGNLLAVINGEALFETAGRGNPLDLKSLVDLLVIDDNNRLRKMAHHLPTLSLKYDSKGALWGWSRMEKFSMPAMEDGATSRPLLPIIIQSLLFSNNQCKLSGEYFNSEMLLHLWQCIPLPYRLLTSFNSFFPSGTEGSEYYDLKIAVGLKRKLLIENEPEQYNTGKIIARWISGQKAAPWIDLHEMFYNLSIESLNVDEIVETIDSYYNLIDDSDSVREFSGAFKETLRKKIPGGRTEAPGERFYIRVLNKFWEDPDLHILKETFSIFLNSYNEPLNMDSVEQALLYFWWWLDHGDENKFRWRARNDAVWLDLFLKGIDWRDNPPFFPQERLIGLLLELMKRLNVENRNLFLYLSFFLMRSLKELDAA